MQSYLFEHDPNLCVGSPLRAAMTACAVNNDIEVLGDTDGCRQLYGRAGLRKISDSAFNLGRFIAEDNKRRLEHTPTRSFAFFGHRL